MYKKLLFDKIKESFMAVLPMGIAVVLVSFFAGLESQLIFNFVVGALLLVLGLALFSIGAEASMMDIASKIGEFLVKSKKLILIIAIVFVLGFLVMFAEPALYVLTEQFKSVPSWLLILVVSLGMAIFVTIAVLRIIFQISLRVVVWIGYGLVFLLGLIVTIVNPDFIAVAFDSGAVATGPLLVPFIMALAYGITKNIGNKDAEMDSFGLISIISLGPIFAVLILGLFNDSNAPDPALIPSSMFELFMYYLGSNFKDMLLAITPFVAFFLIFQFTVFKFDIKKVIKVLVGFLYIYLGLVLFLTGANAGLVQLATELGNTIVQAGASWILIPIGMLFGSIVVAAEPAVMALNKQVEEVSAGAVSKKLMIASLSIGVAISVGLAAIRVLTGISIWWILAPTYAIILVLLIKTPRMFYSIALDAGGAVSGVLTTTFLMPFILGAGQGAGANILTDAYGLVAFIAMTPILTVQIIGLLVTERQRRLDLALGVDNEVINLESEDA